MQTSAIPVECMEGRTAWVQKRAKTEEKAPFLNVHAKQQLEWWVNAGSAVVNWKWQRQSFTIFHMQTKQAFPKHAFQKRNQSVHHQQALRNETLTCNSSAWGTTAKHMQPVQKWPFVSSKSEPKILVSSGSLLKQEQAWTNAQWMSMNLNEAVDPNASCCFAFMRLMHCFHIGFTFSCIAFAHKTICFSSSLTWFQNEGRWGPSKSSWCRSNSQMMPNNADQSQTNKMNWAFNLSQKSQHGCHVTGLQHVWWWRMTCADNENVFCALGPGAKSKREKKVIEDVPQAHHQS